MPSKPAMPPKPAAVEAAKAGAAAEKAAASSAAAAAQAATAAKAAAATPGVVLPPAKRARLASVADAQSPVPVSERPNVAGVPVPVPLSEKAPELPTGDNKTLRAQPTMKKVVPWVLKQLPMKLSAVSDQVPNYNPKIGISRQLPLEIAQAGSGPGGSGVAGGKNISSYKEAWNTANAWMSFQSNGCYEAGGNLLWVDPEVADSDSFMPTLEISWAWLLESCDTVLGVSETDTGKSRIRFPVVLHCCRKEGLVGMTEDAYPYGLLPLAGHGLIWAWFLSMFQALKKNDMEKVLMLYECALTTTLSVFSTTDRKRLTIESTKMSEVCRVQAEVGVDNFLVFARKLEVFADQKGNLPAAEVMQKQYPDLKYDGGLINKDMITAIGLIKAIRDERVDELISELDMEFGSRVLTASYNKLTAFCRTVKRSPELAAWVLENMLMSLRRKELDKSFFSWNAYQKQRRRQPSPNFMQLALAMRCVVQHLHAIVKSVAPVDAKLSTLLHDRVLSVLGSPLLYHQAFPIGDVTTKVNEDQEDTCAQVEEPEPATTGGDDFITELGKTCPKAAVSMAMIIKNMFSAVYMEGLVALTNENQPEALLQSADDDQVLKNLSSDLHALMKSLQCAEEVVSVSSEAVPAMSFRQLVRQTSNPEDANTQADRADAWKRAVAKRKKLVTLVQVSNPRSKASYEQALNASNAKGVLECKVEAKKGETRLIVVSADLMTQKGKKPWLEASLGDEKILTEMVDFAVGFRGSRDVVMCWDGCQKKQRKVLDDAISKLPCSAELTMVYKVSWNAWAKKKYFLASENMEMGYVSMPVSRGKVVVKARSTGFNACGENNSHWTTFTGVMPPPRLCLPRISAEDKMKIFGAESETHELPPKWRAASPAGVPGFWGETKSVATWEMLLDEFNVKAVIDVTPGSGLLASASMSRGIPYVGLAFNKEHMAWLTNIVDRASLKYICQSGGTLYQEDLALLLKDLFADVVNGNDDITGDDAINCSDDEEET